MNTVFKFRDGSHLKGDPQKVGEALMGIRQSLGALRALDVVEAAKVNDSVLHRYFEWNDEKAAAEYRNEQARHLMRSVTIVHTDSHGDIRPIRAFAKISTQEVDSYEPIATVLADKGLRDKVLREVRGEIKSLKAKVETYEEFSDVLSSLDSVDAVIGQHLQGAQPEAVLG